MPSWNIHTAHVERLLCEEGPSALGIRDENLFLFGNLVPDIYVGYMVPNPTRKIKYRETHFADPVFIPAPDAAEFYRRHVRGKDADDLALGAWTHLLADHYYNLRTSEYLARIGEKPGTRVRIRKQGDFDRFGRTLSISLVPQVTDELLSSCARFEQYRIEEEDVRAAVKAQAAIVRRNAEERVEGVPAYRLLTPEFFDSTFAEVDAVMREALALHAAGGDPTHLGGYAS